MTQHENGDASAAAGTTERFVGMADARRAIDRVIASAHRTLRIFEPDLADPGYRSIERIGLIEAFLAAGRGNRIRIVLHEIRQLERECPRILALLRYHSHAMEIRMTVDSARNAHDALVIADEHSYWHRAHVGQPRSIAVLDDAAATAPWAGRFEEIWESSDAAVSATVLGL